MLVEVGVFINSSCVICACSVTSNSLHPLHCSWPGSSVHGIFQAQMLKWMAFPSPGDIPDSGIKLTPPALAGKLFITEPPNYGLPRWC